MTATPARTAFARTLTLLVVFVAAASALAALSRLHWFLELFSHYALHYAVAALIAALALWPLRRRRWALAGLALASWNAFVAAHGLALMTRAEGNVRAELTIFHFNVGFRHPEPRRVVDYVLANAERFDVVVLIETPPHWEQELARLEAVYPHANRELVDSPYGFAVFSRRSPSASLVVQGPPEFAHGEVRLALPDSGVPIAIYAVHPPPPISAALAHARNAKLDHVARAIAGRPEEHAVVVGDFNLTPYAPEFATFTKRSGLRAVRSGLLAAGTWPVLFGGAWFGIPIDHSFIAPQIVVSAREVGPALGSDHLPVTLRIAAATAAR